MDHFSLPADDLVRLGFGHREILKFSCFGDVVAPVFQERVGDIGLLVDLCAGNGLGSFSFHYNGIARESLMIDSVQPPRFKKLEKLFQERTVKKR